MYHITSHHITAVAVKCVQYIPTYLGGRDTVLQAWDELWGEKRSSPDLYARLYIATFAGKFDVTVDAKYPAWIIQLVSGHPGRCV